ncbi:hypothetical protein DYE48_02255 [Halobacillus trueperi]|uniref:Uncharacterized protein n=1 Tax=Halobacillus trueperi TaxID=156205 RepID=A0A3E0JEL2_9BACI|nr:hypothetical protein DYE48_02255 [Halobacillus trueperi]
MHGETPQDAVRGGSPRSRGKRVIPLRPHLLNKSLEIEPSTNLPSTLITDQTFINGTCFFRGCDDR